MKQYSLDINGNPTDAAGASNPATDGDDTKPKPAPKSPAKGNATTKSTTSSSSSTAGITKKRTAAKTAKSTLVATAAAAGGGKAKALRRGSIHERTKLKDYLASPTPTSTQSLSTAALPAYIKKDGGDSYGYAADEASRLLSKKIKLEPAEEQDNIDAVFDEFVDYDGIDDKTA
jgi:hypothetical protein